MISSKFTLGEKAGLSFPAGIFFVTLIMLLMDAVSIPLTRGSILTGLSVFVVGLIMWTAYRWRKNLASLSLASLRKPFSFTFGEINAVWILFVVLIVYVEFLNFQKCIFWPPYDGDSLAGFETIGYIISQEHTLKGLSIFQEDYMAGIHTGVSYSTYAPLVQLSYAFVYMLGAETSKIIPGLMYAFFLFAFYSVSKRIMKKTAAAIITFLVLLTPEMLAFSSLSMTNVIHAVYASLGIVYLTVWLRERKKKDLYLSAALLAMNGLCRMEGVVFIGAASCILFADTLSKKNYRDFAVYVLIAVSGFAIWNVFMKLNGIYADSIIITKPFWDTHKASTIWKYMLDLYESTTYYGITFIAFVAGFFINLILLIRKRDNLYLLSTILLAMMFYVVLLYQIDYIWDSIENVLSFSAKRFMFCFIPLLWYYTGSNGTVIWAMNKAERFLSLRKPD
ncbi:MAG: glycosyltransferase family 39 protein [Tannerella sp.]|nr:glycosyltransferase family 39 protein [Tannerella sp.]